MKLPPVLLLLLLLVGGSRRTQATWYSENVPNGADIIQMDLRWPWWPSGSYFANWNSSFNPKPNNLSFYAGFTSFLEDGPGQTPNPEATRQDAFRPGSVWTFWGSDTTGTPVRFSERPHIESILNACAKDGYRVRDLLLALIESPIFTGPSSTP
jgi:hypothetical protein